jgi:hypothetical protein
MRLDRDASTTTCPHVCDRQHRGAFAWPGYVDLLVASPAELAKRGLTAVSGASKKLGSFGLRISARGTYQRSRGEPARRYGPIPTDI